MRTALAVMLAVALAAVLGGDAADATAAKGKGKGKPRLSIGSLSPPPAGVPEGSTLRVDGVVRNAGRKPGGGPRFRGAIQMELRGPGIENTRIGTVAIPRVGRRSKAPFSGSVGIPAGLGPGNGVGSAGPFDLVACIRAQGADGRLRCRRAPGRVLVTDPTDYTPGARSLGDRLFPQIGNGGYDALGYEIALDYEPATNSFSPGTSTTMTAEATQDLSELSMDFQRDLTVSAVIVDGAVAEFEQVDAVPEFAPGTPAADQPAKLVITPRLGIRDGRKFAVEVAYSGVPDEITDADGSLEGWVRACQVLATETACDGSFTVNEPIGVQSWYPSNNYPSDKATIGTKITVPTTHETIGTGELVSRIDNGDGTATWTWDEDDPTSTYLASATVGLFDYTDDTSMTEALTGRAIPIYLAIDSAKLPTAKTTFTTRTLLIGPTTNFFSDRFGPYPFDSTGAVSDISEGVTYALENQTKPHYGGSAASSLSVSTQAHEIAHQWMGDSVGPATWEEIWFNEGWATFAQELYDVEADETAMQAFFDDVYATPDSEWDPAPANLPGPQALFSEFPVYTRPAGMLEGYREIIGDGDFYAFARGLTVEYAYDTISIDEFIAEAKAASGFTGAELVRLDEYFQQWLLGTSKPTLTPDDFPAP